MKQKTAMMELRSILIDWSERYRKSDMGDEFVVVIKAITIIEQELLEKEKEQIMNAYETGDKYKFEISGEKYYNQTYKQD